LDLPLPSFSLFSPPPFLEQFQQVLFFNFLMWLQNTCTIYTLIPPFLAHPHYTYLQKRFIFPSCPSLFLMKCILIVPFCLGTLGLCISCFNLINPLPPLLTHVLSPCSPNICQLSLQWIILYSYINGLFQYFSLTFSFSLTPSITPSDGLTNMILFSLSHCVYIYI
jgi:hypothetical protein